MKICIAGKNDIAVNCVDFVLNNYKEFQVSIAVNKTDNGQDGWQKSLLKYASEHDLPILSLDELYKIDGLFFFSLEYDCILKTEKFNSDRLFNIHFSDLPKYKGMYTSVWPILNGDSSSGVTLHLIDDGIDTGDIIDKIVFKIDENDNSMDLYLKYLKYGEELFQKLFPKIISLDFKYKPQSSFNSTYHSIKSIDFNNIKIDLNVTAFQLCRQIKAYCFKEYQYPCIAGNEINDCRILNRRSNKKAGTLVEVEEASITIATIDYDVILYAVKGNGP